LYFSKFSHHSLLKFPFSEIKCNLRYFFVNLGDWCKLLIVLAIWRNIEIVIKKFFYRICMVLLRFLQILIINFIWLMVLLKILVFHTVTVWLIVWWQVLWSLRIVARSLIGILFLYFTDKTKLLLFIIDLKLRFAITQPFDCSSLKVIIFWVYCWILWKLILFLIITLQKSTNDAKINFLFFI